VCFVLYAGTQHPLPRREWRGDSPKLSVLSLTGREMTMKSHFSAPEIQYIGSTSNCGCDFPNAMLQNGSCPTLELPPGFLEVDAERVATEQRNKQALVDLLQSSGENFIELYAIWDGDFAEPPRAIECISAAEILADRFAFKERCLYRVCLDEPRTD